MSHRHSLLGLPCEIRQLIYREYFALPGGYILSPNLRQLTASNGEPIDLNLIYTCSLIARETKELAFYLNTITISTIHSEYLNLAASRFSSFLPAIYFEQENQLKRVFVLIDEDMHNKVVNEFPSFKENMGCLLLLAQNYRPQYFDMTHYDSPGYHISSPREPQHRKAIRYLLHLITSAYGKEVMDAIKAYVPPVAIDLEFELNLPYETVCKLINLCDDPWDIPTRSQLRDMADVIPRIEAGERKYLINGGLKEKYRFSAVAATISFLRSLPPAMRHQIRNITINEDHDSEPYTQCHVEGLIPFFKENLHLRVERRISLWKTLFQRAYIDDSVNDLSKDLALWFASIFALDAADVPPNSMITFFDSSPAPEACSQIFQNIIQRDIALARTPMTAYTESDLREGKKHMGFDIDLFYGNKFGDLVLGLQHLSKGLPTLRCNFDPGEMWDIQHLCEKYSAPGIWYGHWVENEWNLREELPDEAKHPLIMDYAKKENTYTEEEYGKLLEYARRNGFA